MPMPQAGDAAPDFQLQDQDGNTVTLSRFAGKNVVLYFYPKDDTPGCTVEACSFRDEHSTMEAAGAVVLGVSADTTASHRKFATKFSLPFPLLADTEHQMSEAYGVWGEKSLYGRKFLGITRATFLIGPDGKVKQVWPKVKVTGHVVDVLAALGAKPTSLPSGELPAPGSSPAVEESSAGDEDTREAQVASAPVSAPARVPVTRFDAPKRKAPRQGDAGAGTGATAEVEAPEARPAKAAPVKTAAPASAKKAAPVKAAAPAPAKKAPPAKKAAPAKKAPPAKKAAPTKKAPSAKKGAAKKAAAAKKGAAKKAAPAKKGAAKKAAAAKKATPVKKGAAKKSAPAKKAARAKKK